MHTHRFAQALSCERCARTFSASDRSVDLTPTAGVEPRVYKPSFWGGTQIFRWAPHFKDIMLVIDRQPRDARLMHHPERPCWLEMLLKADECLSRSPLVSFAYERGWRRSFTWAGFPGEQKEYDLAMGYLQSAYGEVGSPPALEERNVICPALLNSMFSIPEDFCPHLLHLKCID